MTKPPDEPDPAESEQERRSRVMAESQRHWMRDNAAPPEGEAAEADQGNGSAG